MNYLTENEINRLTPVQKIQLIRIGFQFLERESDKTYSSAYYCELWHDIMEQLEE
tara:strand:+ start:181 stop:345 length:165 start_codon:yes stop_codon:yes gene_type:complete